MKTKFIPCPVCGSIKEPFFWLDNESERNDKGEPLTVLTCEDCRADVEGYTQEECIKKWNNGEAEY